MTITSLPQCELCLDLSSALKIRPNYVMLDTKNKKHLQVISQALQHRMHGMKSFVFALWRRTLFKPAHKSLRARAIIKALVKRKDQS